MGHVISEEQERGREKGREGEKANTNQQVGF